MHIVGLAFNLGSSSIGQQQQINQTQVQKNLSMVKWERQNTNNNYVIYIQTHSNIGLFYGFWEVRGLQLGLEAIFSLGIGFYFGSTRTLDSIWFYYLTTIQFQGWKTFRTDPGAWRRGRNEPVDADDDSDTEQVELRGEHHGAGAAQPGGAGTAAEPHEGRAHRQGVRTGPTARPGRRAAVA